MNPSRVVLVTGGSKGIGYCIAARLAKAGHRVAATYRSGEVPSEVLGVQCDVTDPAQVEAAFAQVESSLGNVEVVVANAGITRDTLLMQDVRRGLGSGHRDQPDRGVPGRAAGRPADDPGAIRPDRLHLLGGRTARLGRTGQLRGVQVRPRGDGTLARPRARIARRDRKCGGAWIHRDRHDCRAGRGPGQEVRRADPAWADSVRWTTSQGRSSSSAATRPATSPAR